MKNKMTCKKGHNINLDLHYLQNSALYLDLNKLYHVCYHNDPDYPHTLCGIYENPIIALKSKGYTENNLPFDITILKNKLKYVDTKVKAVKFNCNAFEILKIISTEQKEDYHGVFISKIYNSDEYHFTGIDGDIFNKLEFEKLNII
jgi:hypothetical protein